MVLLIRRGVCRHRRGEVAGAKPPQGMQKGAGVGGGAPPPAGGLEGAQPPRIPYQRIFGI